MKMKLSLKEDSKNVIWFMAFNGLVANQSKTEFMVLNEKDKTSLTLRELTVGNVKISRTTT